MRVAVHQPHYLPWLRYLDKVARADRFVVLDDAQFNKNGWQNRNRLKGPAGPYLVTVPVRHRFACPLGEVEVADDRWRRRHLQALRSSYGRMPGFDRFYRPVERLLGRPWRRLNDLNLELLQVLLELLDVRTPLVRASALAVPGRGSERLAALCRQVGASRYLTGAWAVGAYLEPATLTARGIAVDTHVWTAPTYRQAHPEAGFAADLSVVDLLAAEPERAGAILAASGRIEPLAAPA
jgi:hypothetical protein